MTNATAAAGHPAADPPARTRNPGRLVRPADQRTLERERLETRARGTEATSQLLRCFPGWTRALEQLTFRTLERLAAQRAGRPQRPGRVAQPRRAGAGGASPPRPRPKLTATRLTSAAIAALIDGQAVADRDAGLDWSTVATPASALDERLGARPRDGCRSTSTTRRCGRTSSISGARSPARSGSTSDLADDLSRWVLANPSQFDAGDLRCWRIGSDTWLSLAGERLGAVGQGRAAGRPVRRAGDRRRATGGS